MADRISLRLRRNDMSVFTTIDEPGGAPVVHVAGRHPVALCPRCARPSGTTNGCGWRDVIDVVRTVVITLSVCVRRFLCEEEDCPQRSFDERFEGIGRGGASSRALAFFVAPGQHRGPVVCDRVGSHRPHPRHLVVHLRFGFAEVLAEMPVLHA